MCIIRQCLGKEKIKMKKEDVKIRNFHCVYDYIIHFVQKVYTKVNNLLIIYEQIINKTAITDI